VTFKWTREYEEKLEEILMKHYFDFHAATKEFSRLVNGDPNNNPEKKQLYQIDVKTLQLRWTDIEIRNHRLSNLARGEPEE